MSAHREATTPMPPEPLDAAAIAGAVSERELLRLFGMPRGRALEGDLRARVDAARVWYAERGAPIAVSRRLDVARVGESSVTLGDGSLLRSGDLAASLRAARGRALVVLAVSAGREVAAEIGRAWKDDRPDEAYFLDRFAAAVAEALVARAAAAECRSAAAAGETLLAPHSPGCGDFEIGEQQRLMALLGAASAGERLVLGPLALLPTGALDPPHTLLAALGVTREPRVETTPRELCRGCTLEPCAFRRAPRTATVAAGAGVGA